MRIITLDDFIDSYAKLKQRGFSFIRSKLNPDQLKRTRSAFNELNISSSNFWIIPKVNKRWNELVTGDKDLEYEDYVMKRYFKDKKNLRMLSLGSGICNHELKFAEYQNFEEIICLDINEVLFEEAKRIASEKGIDTIDFRIQSIYDYDFPDDYFDIVFFHASLHHFKNLDDLLGKRLLKTLKPNGHLLINEYVGPDRLQFPKHQIQAINTSLQLIPKKYRQRYKLNFFKNKIYGSGVLRMIIADPSECVESSSILPVIHQYYDVVEESALGNNILMTALKDISHHFLDLDPEKEKILNDLFAFEDKYLKDHSSDFVFGIYQKKGLFN